MDVVWYHNDRRIFFTAQSRIRAKQIDCQYKLLLDDIEYEDQGYYEMRCEHVKTSCQLTVKRLTTSFLENLKNIHVQEGVNIIFIFDVSSITESFLLGHCTISMSFIEIEFKCSMVQRWYSNSTK